MEVCVERAYGLEARGERITFIRAMTHREVTVMEPRV